MQSIKEKAEKSQKRVRKKTEQKYIWWQEESSVHQWSHQYRKIYFYWEESCHLHFLKKVNTI